MDIICTRPCDGEEEDDDETGFNTANGDGTPAQNVQVREEKEFYLYETYIRHASLVSVAALLDVWVVSRMRK